MWILQELDVANMRVNRPVKPENDEQFLEYMKSVVAKSGNLWRITKEGDVRT
jgi:hypothetical protein